MISQERLNNIERLSSDDCLLIIRSCEERLALVTVKEYCSITGKGKRATYYNIKESKIKSISISGVLFVCINQ